MTVLVGGCWQGWFLLTGLPWKPPCCASYLHRAPTNLSWHQFPRSSIPNEFNLQTQCLPFLSVQQVKEFFKLVEHLWASLLVMSAQCNIWNKNFLHFSPLHTESFSLTFSGSEFGKTNMHIYIFFFFLFYWLNFQQSQII